MIHFFFAFFAPSPAIFAVYARGTVYVMYTTCWSVRIIDKVYKDGPCGSKILAGVLLACFERVSLSHVTHF